MSDKEFNRYSFWTSDEREKIGLQCKRVIDAGRASYLRQLGYKAMLVEYVGESSVTGECHASRYTCWHPDYLYTNF
ncbi:hypothetical protein EB796_007372 [Bugula neritina]|uniref:tRNA:m(4)X modification enzyme TRM13 n=1 Tax=Bugula neritina TaxID=10212 RepID=A0A7J7K6T3_BUGNE|nr:hypothetical protein EB796_007372 [Bugula neritina]